MSTTYTVSELKKLAIGGRDKKRGQTPFVATYEHDGKRWATNSYWLVPAARIGRLLGHHNLTDDPGVFDVNGKVSRRPDTEPPRCDRFLDAADYTIELAREEVEGVGPIYTRSGDGPFLAIYTRPDGERVAFNADFLAWILAAVDEPISYGERWKREVAGNVGPAIITVRQVDRSLGNCAFFARKEKRSGGCYRDKEGAPGGREWVPEEWHDAGDEMIGVLMPVRIG